MTVKDVMAPIVLASIFFVAASFANDDMAEHSWCRNCEAIVVLESADAQPFIDILALVSSMPLRGVLLDQEISANTARVVVSTDPEYAAKNGINSFDIAKKMTELAKYNAFNIKSVTATWTANQ